MKKTKCARCKKRFEKTAVTTWGEHFCIPCYEQPYLYSNGLPFGTKVQQNIDDLVTRIRNRKASMLIIDGPQGEGKTTLAVHIAEYIEKRQIDYEEQLAVGGSDFSKKLRLGYERGFLVLVYDESGDFNRRGALTRLNGLLNRVFETYRALNILVILVLPFFAVLDNDLFDKGIPRMLLHVDGRSRRQGNIKGYSAWRMYYLRAKMKKATVPPQAYGWVSPNFYDHFLDLSPSRGVQLDKYSVGGKLEVLEIAEIHADGLQTYNQISVKLNRSVRWVQLKLRELDIAERKVHQKKKYFAPEVIDILSQHLDGGD